MDYGMILSKSFQALKQKKFWLIGFLFAIVSAGTVTNDYQINQNQRFDAGYRYNFGTNYEMNYDQSNPIIDYIMSINPAIIILLILTLILVGIIFFIIRYILQGSMIKGLYEVESGAKPSFGQIFSYGWQSAFRLFGVGFVIWFLPVIVILALIMAAIIPIIISPETGVIIFCILVPFIILFLILIVIPLSLLNTLAYRVTVLEKEKIFKSISAAWKLLKENIGSILLAWLIMVGIGIAYGVIQLVISGITIMPFSFFFRGDNMNNYLLFILTSIPGRLIIYFITGLFLVFSNNYWNGVYGQIIIKRPAENISEPEPTPTSGNV